MNVAGSNPRELPLDRRTRRAQVARRRARDRRLRHRADLAWQVAYLPTEELKLDRSFVAQLPESRVAAIVETVATLAAALGFSAVAEGVETSQQAELLADLGYPLAQGFHFARPESGDSMLRRFRHRATVSVD